MTENNQTIGEIHIIIRADGRTEISTSYNVPELNLAIDHLKKMILDGDLTPTSLSGEVES